MATSVREYAILYVGGRRLGGSTIAGGGNAIFATGVHEHDGPEHSGLLPVERLSTTELNVAKVAGPDGAGAVAFRLLDVADIVTTEMDTTLVAAPDGAGALVFRAETGGGGSSGALVLLEQHTASGSASLDFTACISATYDEYVIEFVEVIPATLGAALGCRISTNGGSTWDATSAHYYNNNLYASTSAWTGVAAGGTYVQIAHSVHNAGILGVSGSVRFWPLGGSQRFFVGQVSYLPSAADRTVNLVNSDFELGAFDAVRFFFSSGNIASGTIRIYGVKK